MITTQEYYKAGENFFLKEIDKIFGRSISLETNPEIKIILECVSMMLYNAQREMLFLQQEFIENPLTYKKLVAVEKLQASLANGKVSFNANTAGVLINETNVLQGVNNVLYTPLDVYESKLVSMQIDSISSDGIGTITVTTLEDIVSIASGNMISIVNVTDSDFNINNTVATIVNLRTLKYSKNISLKTSNGGNIEAITLTAEVESQTFGNVGNLTNGSIVNILAPLQNLSSTGYVNFTNITGGADEESDESLSSRISIKLSEDITTSNDANMRNKALEFPGTTRAWVKTSEVTKNTNVFHMRDNSIPPFPTIQDDTNLLNHLINVGAIPVGIFESNIIVKAPTELKYNIQYAIIYNELNNEEYKSLINENLQKLFNNFDLNQRATISNIKSIITTQTINFYPAILNQDLLLDNLIDGISILYDNTITGTIISTLGTITYP